MGSQKDLDSVGARERMTQELLEGRLNPEWRMANWVYFQMNSKEKEDKGKMEEKVCKMEKEDQRRKEKDNGRKSSVGKLRSKKMESNPKERPKPPSKETNLERMTGWMVEPRMADGKLG